MTPQQFDETKFGFGDRAIYKGKVYLICTVEFEERLLGLVEDANDESTTHVRCESIEYLLTPSQQ